MTEKNWGDDLGQICLGMCNAAMVSLLEAFSFFPPLDLSQGQCQGAERSWSWPQPRHRWVMLQAHGTCQVWKLCNAALSYIHISTVYYSSGIFDSASNSTFGLSRGCAGWWERWQGLALPVRRLMSCYPAYESKLPCVWSHAVVRTISWFMDRPITRLPKWRFLPMLQISPSPTR